ncbi:hypothetical protein [Methylomonas rosea]|uniref:SPOR domain-containing protein n=1 Tax=Methylomonas rosea TaxID=2952227 RepID=A0ABT1TXH6_9GAMM|nr:hypothetical protein [Methylomonas sp. WSC-7]MCQ8119465.1 hypothetical protein [Methylomonas sp. WSC-7]
MLSIDNVSKVVSVAKDAVSVFRDFSLLFLIILLVLFPRELNQLLVEAGFEEGSIVGMKWKAKVSEQDKEIINAQSLIDDLKDANLRLLNVVSDIRPLIKDESVISALNSLQESNRSILNEANTIQSNLKKITSENSELIDKSMANKSDVKWGVVFGGDNSLEYALDEIKKAKNNLGLDIGKIYLRQGSYRSVIPSVDRQQAEYFLSILKKQRNDSYIVNMDKWCNNHKYQEKYIQCL